MSAAVFYITWLKKVGKTFYCWSGASSAAVLLGTTAGAFHIINSNANLSALQLHTLKFYPQLEEEAQQSIGLHRPGGIYFASTKERLNYLVQERAKNRAGNPDMEFIDLAEAKRMHPLIDEKRFLGALYDPLDGYIDPASVVQAYAKAAKKHGAKVFQHTMVNAISPQNGDWEVQTDKGVISAEYVVNAGGLWAREVGQMVGWQPPLMAMEHHYLITDNLPEVENLGHELPNMVDFDGNAYGRQEGRGMLFGTYEEDGQPWSADKTPWDFGHELLPDNMQRIGARLEVAFQHFPALAEAGIKKVVNGPFTFAPDGNALIGPVPGLRNFWSACAVMAGFAQGAGIGKVFADWLIEGEPGMDVFAMDVARFGEFATRQYTRHKVVENFGRRFMIAYPNEEPPAMRPWRTTALYDCLKASGAVFGAAFGLEHALWFAPNAQQAVEAPTFHRSNAFSHVGEESQTVREGVGFIETANFAKYEVVGKGAADYLDVLLAGELPQIGRMRLSPMLSDGGRLLGDLSVGKLSENEFFIVGSGAAQMAHMRRFLVHLPKSGVAVHNRSTQLHGIAIAGPDSRNLMSRLTNADMSAAVFRFMDIRRMEVSGVSAIVARVSFTGEMGYEIYCAPEYQRVLYEALIIAGEGLGLRPFGARALMSLRLEKNFGAWTMDFREDFTPLQAGLDAFVAYDKTADFIGKQAAVNERQTGALQKRINLAVDADGTDANGDEPIFKDGEIVGFVTSGGYGHTVGKSFAMGYVKTEAADAGGEFAVEILGDMRPATVQTEPAYDPAGLKMRG